MKITWFGHSCFMLESEHGTIVFDPFENGYVPGYKDIPKGTEADEVICSHGHGDHSAAHLIKYTGRSHSYNITFLPTYHDEEKGALRGKNNIALIEFDGLKVVHMGDLGCPLKKEEAALLKCADVVMIPVGGYYTIDAKKAFDILKEIEAKVIIPMHYRGEDFGFDEIASIDDFTCLCDNVVYLESNSAVIDEKVISQKPVLIFKKP